MRTGPICAPGFEAKQSDPALLLAVFQQNWENARHIKNERLWFTNIYAIITAGILTLLQMVHGHFAFEITIISFMALFSVMGILTSFRLKAELEECLHSIQKIAAAEGLDSLMALSRAGGVQTRYPQFRWIFPWFYGLVSIGFFVLLVFKLLS